MKVSLCLMLTARSAIYSFVDAHEFGFYIDEFGGPADCSEQISESFGLTQRVSLYVCVIEMIALNGLTEFKVA